MRHREARWRRRRRRAQRRQEQRTDHPHQQLAHQIRRRQMANQQFQQQEYHRNRCSDERERQEHQDRDLSDDVQSPSPTVDELFEEVIDERLLELFDWDTIFLNDQRDQDQLIELEDIAAMEQPALVQQDVELSQHNKPTTQSLDSMLHQLHQIQQHGDIEQPQVMETQQQYPENTP
ncbi:unnamed protein product [Didymodactylos carnosus]|uniref:Uncharacterized protein n=1 Tax=Didymodactylos carnosus TaxID=1234261 RepID=A0A815INR9_9BILA|nr:unnamed protein product [Didymodactylos carnosus]CAF4252469.1 unnamed protein product [Didymodactylos carnosus]